MKTHQHIAVGVAASALPDAVLFLYGWRRTWLPDTHPLVRVHRFIHSRTGLVAVWLICWSLHIVIDWWTHGPNQQDPTL